MAWFEYEGLTPGGTAVAGTIEAADHDEAKAELLQMQVELRELRPTARPARKIAPLSPDDLLFFNEQLASLADAGIALDEGLAQLARDVTSPRLRHWIEALAEDLRRGVPIDQAVAARESGLPILYSRIIRAGIDSGQLATTLLNLNQHLQLIHNTRRLIWEAVSYPLLVFALAVGIMSAFLGMIVPQFKEIFADFGTSLPLLTIFIIELSQHFWTILSVGAAIVFALAAIWHALRCSSGGQAWRERLISRIPMLGRMHRASLVARFLRAVATAVATGIPLPQAMRLSAAATGSELLSRDAERLADEVEQGESIFTANQSAEVIPPLFGYCVQVATGREALPEAMGKLARAYENRAFHAQEMLRVLLLPFAILVVGGVLAIGIISVFLPLVSLVNCVSGGG